jgi:hypothetical protein
VASSSADWGVARDPLSQLSFDALPEEHRELADAIAADLVDLVERHPNWVNVGGRINFYKNPEPWIEVGFVKNHVKKAYVVKHFKAPLKPLVNGFVSYSHKDENFFEEFRTHVSVLQANGYLDLWSDKDIEPGSEWEKEIRDAIERAGLGVLLVTPRFIDSEFIRYDELPLMLLKMRDKRMEVFWIPVVKCDLAGTGLEELQAICNASEPLMAMQQHVRDAALADIAAKLRSKLLGPT